MKLFIILLFSLLSFTILAQETQKKENQFVRIYNKQGVKIQKGNIINISDSTISVKRSNGTYTVNYSEIGWIKTKRSFGHRIGAITGVTTICFAFSGASIFNDGSFLSPGESALLLGAVGLIYGSVAGVITELFTKIEKFSIQGDLNAWKRFKEKFQVIEDEKAPPKTSIWA